jgi:limonene 1,2-monooxygenase
LLGVMMQLLDGREPVTCNTDWLQLRDATLQPRPSQKPTLPVAVASVQSPAGVLLAG